MGNSITYSFIIPHYNRPDELIHCLRSIPRRDDVEIIVVDDCSDPSLFNIDDFHLEDGRCVKIIKTPHNGGGGLARNVGIEHAQGRWLLFADSDDSYESDVLDVLDEYKDANYDVVYYSFAIANEDKSENLHGLEDVRKRIESGESEADYIRYQFYPPWNKMVKREFVLNKNIRFEEVPRGNDIQFALLVGRLSEKRKYISNRLYCYYLNPKSVSFGSFSRNKQHCFILGHFKCIAFMKYIGHPEWVEHGILRIIHGWLVDKPLSLISIYLWMFISLPYIYWNSRKYVRMVENRENGRS